ncbi:MAG: ABC transporter permease [Humidesulfovibrio sp.]|nr:ABC transporter permease [Humidesulfovibrio sp.]
MRMSYVFRELYLRRRRSLTSMIGLAVGIALLVVVNALSSAFREAARAPLAEVGADISIQRNGDVPQELAGPVFPCSAVTLRGGEVERVRQVPGITGLATGVLLWVFDADQFTIVMGLEPDNPLGPGRLRHFITQGRFLSGKAAAGTEALLEVNYAQEHHLKVGDNVSVAGKRYPVVGLVDASKAAKIAVAGVYLPLTEAQALALSSPQVQSVSPFAPGDVNLLFLTADQRRVPGLAATLKGILGDKVSISTPESFLKQLGNLFALSDTFALAVSAIAIATAALLVLKTTAGNLNERAREIGVLKCLGWTNADVIKQLLAETLIQCLFAGVLGLAVAWLACMGLSFLEVRIPIPWEMAPTPHFLPGGGEPVFKTLSLPMRLAPSLAAFALSLCVLIGILTSGLLVRRIARIKPSEVLRHE